MTCLRKKANLGPYIHHPIPKIEKYANQSEWVENTLMDRENTKVDVENALCDLERQFDESSFLQVLQEQEPAMSTIESQNCPFLNNFPHPSFFVFPWKMHSYHR